MAPAEDSAFFPPLDLCLDGTAVLFPWKVVFTAIAELEPSASPNAAVSRHLEDPRSIQALSRAFEPPVKATAQTRAIFDNLTSAINITPTRKGKYDIQQIKDDALWLSKEVGVSEILALRTVVLEWQSRTAVRLRDGVTEDSMSPGIAPGISTGFKSSLLLSRSLRPLHSSQIIDVEAFESLEARQIRLLETHLSERQYACKVTELLVFDKLARTVPAIQGPTDRDSGTIEFVATQILRTWNLDGVQENDKKHFLVSLVGYLESKAQDINKGSGWLLAKEHVPSIELFWTETLLLEIMHGMQLILIAVGSLEGITRSDILLSWFKFTVSQGLSDCFRTPFLENVSGYLEQLQVLIALVSLAVIRMPKALVYLQQMEALVAPPESNDPVAPFLQNSSCLEDVTQILIDAADASVAPLSLAFFAWCMILHGIRESANKAQVTRENRQSQRAVDTYHRAVVSSDNEQKDVPSAMNKLSQQRRASIASDTSQQTTYFEEVNEAIRRLDPNGDPLEYLTYAAIKGSNVFDFMKRLTVDFPAIFSSDSSDKFILKMRSLLLDLLDGALTFLRYDPEVVRTMMWILHGTDSYWDILDRSPDLVHVDPASTFMSSQFLMEHVFQVALTRFPFEIIPFMNLLRALASGRLSQNQHHAPLVQTLSSLETFTALLDEQQAPYKLSGDGDEIFIELKAPLDAVDLGLSSRSERPGSSSSSNAYESATAMSEKLVLPLGTIGRSLTPGKPLVVLWRYSYSGLGYMGLILQRFSEGRSDPHNGDAPSILEVATEVVALLSILISKPKNGMESETEEAAREVLEEASNRLDRDRDVVALIFDLFESELHVHRSGAAENGSVEFLLRCLQFTHALLSIFPHRVWSFLGRSSLVGLQGTENRLATIMTASDLPIGRCEFFLCAIRLLSALSRKTFSHLTSEKASPTALTRFGGSVPNHVGTGIPDKMTRNILLQLERTIIDVFETSRSWKTISTAERLDLNTRTYRLFSDLLDLCYRVDDTSDVSQKLSSCLAPTAEYLTGVFLFEKSENLVTHTLIDTLLEGLNTPCSTVSVSISQSWKLQTKATLALLIRLVRIRELQGRPIALLEARLFESTPVLAKLYTIHHEYRLAVVQLLDALVNGAGARDTQPPSLLGHIGETSAKTFVTLLSDFDKPFEDLTLTIAIWKLLTAVISQRQQWFAAYLLTGTTPRESLKKANNQEASSNAHSQAMLNTAFSKLLRAGSLPPAEVAHVLEFVAITADYWPWVLDEVHKQKDLANACLGLVKSLDFTTSSQDTTISESKIWEIQTAANVVKLFSMLVHQHSDDEYGTIAKTIVPSLDYLMKHGVSAPSYNSSLHSRLRQNFETRFPACKLLQFKHTGLAQPALGNNFYYDQKMARELLSHRREGAKRWDSGFAAELRRANLNLSTVEAQMNLFHSWKSLLMELSNALGTYIGFQKSLSTVICDCLKANRNNTLPELVFSKLAQSRADLVFAILQKFIGAVQFSDEAKDVLSEAWGTLNDHTADLGFSLAGDDAEYTRTLLRILYLAMQPHLQSSPERRSQTNTKGRGERDEISIVLQVLNIVIAKGFRSLTARVHDDVNKVLPSDVGLLNAILRTALRVPGVDRQTEHIQAIFADNATARYASSLFSWSDQLTVNGDPIYAELSLTFLQELSTVTTLGESIVVDGSLTQVSGANIMNCYRRRGGVGPFDEPRRMFGIWTRSILPFLINLLESIGAPIVVEIVTFLAQFRPQLERASSSFDFKPTPSRRDPHARYITLGMASEAHSLALIWKIISMFKAAGASAGVVSADISEIPWDGAAVKEDIESQIQRKNALRGSIVPTDEREEAWSQLKPTRDGSGADNRLEERVLEELRATLSVLESEES